MKKSLNHEERSGVIYLDEVMRQTASPERMYYLERVIERERYLSKT